MKPILIIFLSILFFSSCVVVTTRTQMETKLREHSSPNNIPVYYSEKEVPKAYKTIAVVRWLPLTIFSGRKKIAKRALQKADAYLRNGKLQRIDAIVIDNMYNAYFVVFTDGKPTSSVESGGQNPDFQNESNARPSRKSYTPTSSESLPSIRVGARLGASSLRGTPYLGIQGLYRLKSQPNVEVGAELGYNKASNISRYFLLAQGRYYFGINPDADDYSALRVYPLGGLSLVMSNDIFGWEEKKTSIGLHLGGGAEYRLGEKASGFIEAAMLSNSFGNKKEMNLGIGLRTWIGS